MSDPKPQPLLTRRPIICRRCLHGHMVEVITDRMNSPVEYHCGYCGNYAIVGVPAKWPFMEVVKAPGSSKTAVKPANNISDNYSSPMQVGETIADKTAKKCKVQTEQEEPMDDFFQKHGITREEYKANKQYRLESPARVAQRMGRTGTEMPVAETKGPKAEEKKPARETKPPANDVAKPEKEEAEHSALTAAYNNKELEELAYPDRHTFPLAAPRPPIGLVGKDYITIVAKEEFIERIKEAADRDFRTPEQQVAYYLHKGMEAVGV